MVQGMLDELKIDDSAIARKFSYKRFGTLPSFSTGPTFLMWINLIIFFPMSSDKGANKALFLQCSLMIWIL